MKHLRANAALLSLTLALCCVAYPLVLWVVGQVVFPGKANGSLLTVKEKDGTERVVGSSQIAQPFTGDEYFWPRPSAASYNAAASGGSNWAANNPKLRDRVAEQLGPMIRYKSGSASAGTGPEPRTPQQDIEAWFAAKADRLADWAGEYSVAATNWAKTDYSAKTATSEEKYGLQGELITQWAKDHPEVLDDWKKANPTKTDDPKPEDLAPFYFASYAKVHPGKWPGVVEVERPDKTKIKEIRPVSSDSDIAANTPAICANHFDMWLQDPANRAKAGDLEPVPVDMVTASGSGLDPHITLRNALCVYQLDRVAAKRTPPGGDGKKVRTAIEELVRKHTFTPLSGLVGEPLVNVLELNVALDRDFPVPPAPAK
jgi:K+-transporting ATPase ATPase C chain